MNSNPQNQEIPQEVKDHFDNLVKEVKESGEPYYSFKVTAFPHYQNLAKKDNIFKKGLMLYVGLIIYQSNNWRRAEFAKMEEQGESHFQKDYGERNMNLEVAKNMLIALARNNFEHSLEELNDLVVLCKTSDESLEYWFPMAFLLKQVERIAQKQGLSADQLNILGKWQTISIGYSGNKNNEKVKLKINEILAQAQGKSIGDIALVLLDDGDEICKQINEQIAAFESEKKSGYYQLLALFKKSTQGKPSGKFHQEVEKSRQNIGKEHFTQTLIQWLNDLKKITAVVERQTQKHTYGNQEYEYSYTTCEYLKDSSLVFAKGLIWSFEPYLDKNILQTLAEFAQKCFQKIPGKGPLAMGLGNACIYVLSQGGLEGVSYLSRLKLRIRQASTQSLIENYIRTSAETLGVTPAEIEDMATPSFGLENGKLEEEFDGYKAMINVEGIGETKLEWFKPDGSPMKSVPSVVKENHNLDLAPFRKSLSGNGFKNNFKAMTGSNIGTNLKIPEKFQPKDRRE